MTVGIPVGAVIVAGWLVLARDKSEEQTLTVEAGAILAGDLCLTWADEMYATSGLPADEVLRGRRVFDLMRTQLMGGQFLDILNAARPWDDEDAPARTERVRRVMTYKSAKYSIEHPLLIGATAGGLGPSDLAALSRYGVALGVAFQLRDDLLGVFGDPVTTGKPAGDDLREGKHTVLVAHTLAALDEERAARFARHLGDAAVDDETVAWMCETILAAGAVDAVERDIDRLVQQGLERLDCDEFLGGERPIGGPHPQGGCRGLQGGQRRRRPGLHA